MDTQQDKRRSFMGLIGFFLFYSHVRFWLCVLCPPFCSLHWVYRVAGFYQSGLLVLVHCYRISFVVRFFIYDWPAYCLAAAYM